MRYPVALVSFIVPLLFASFTLESVQAQTVITDSKRLYALSTLTASNVTATTIAVIDNTAFTGARNITVPEFAKALLNTITLSPGLAFTGSSLTFTGALSVTGGAGITTGSSAGVFTITNSGVTSLTAVGAALSGTVGNLTLTVASGGVTSLTLGGTTLFAQTTTTGDISLVPTTTGTPQFFGLGLNTAATNTAILTLSIGSTTTTGIRIRSPASYSGYYWTVQNSAGTDMAYIFGDGGTGATLAIRNAATRVLTVGSVAQTFFDVNAIGTSTQAAGPRICTGAVLGFSTAAEVISPNVGIVSLTSGQLSVVSGTVSGTGSFNVTNALTTATLRVNTGVINSTGLQHTRTSTGGIAALSSSVVTVTWPVAWADTSYTPIVCVEESTTVAGLTADKVVGRSTTTIAVLISNASAGTLTGTVHLKGMHD